MPFKSIPLSLLFCFYMHYSFSQNEIVTENNPVTIQGIITDSTNGEPLAGVTILIKGTKSGAVTDSKGEFILKLKPGNNVLVISYIGFAQKEFVINPTKTQNIHIPISPTITTLGEVTITSQRKFFGNMEYGREIPTINAEIIQKQNANNASDILHARVSGVWATKTSGAPGDHEKIRIRGQNSFFSSAEPLYVVDGVPVPIVNMSSLGIADLNIHDIENVTVLKDASSAALYGFQGGNGVILVDTKKGGDNHLYFSVKYGRQWFNNYYDLMSTKDQLSTIQLAWDLRISSMDKAFPEYSDTLCSHSRQDEIFTHGSIQEYQLAKEGRIGLMKYYLSGNYLNHDGIIKNMGYKRYTFSTRLGWLFWKRLAVEMSYRGSLQDNVNNQEEYNGNSLIFYGISQSPCVECTPDSLFYTETGHQIPRVLNPDYGLFDSRQTPAGFIKINTNKLGINTHALSGFARLQLTDHLNIDVMESFMSRNTKYENILGSQNVEIRSHEDVILLNHQANVSYYNNVGKHNIGIVFANRFYKDNLWWQVDTLDGYIPEKYVLKNSMAAYGLHGSVLRNMISYIGHMSYDYNKIWFISAIANVSKVKEGNHINYYNLFPSVALSCDLAQIRFLQDNRWLDILNLYINWGQSGNYPLNGLSNDMYHETTYRDGANTNKYPTIEQFANHNLKHENTTETDYGIKTSFLKNRLRPGIVYYNKKIENLIMQREIPIYYGGGIMFVNVGEIAVKGIDLSIEAIPIQRHNLTWNMMFNYSKSDQKVVTLIDGKDLAYLNNDALFPDFYIKEGEPLGNIYGYKSMGRWTETDENSDNKLYIEKGGMKYLNADSSNYLLNQNDKVVIGNSIPEYTWNLTNSFQYKNFTIDFTWYASWGLQKYNATRAATYITAVNKEINNYLADTTRAIKYDYFYESSVFIEDASFIRLKSLTFTYEPSKKILNRISFIFSLSFENLVTITKYNGYDPEATIFTDNNFSDNSIDRGSVPNPKAVYASINLKF